jgi:hypothetical protein
MRVRTRSLGLLALCGLLSACAPGLKDSGDGVTGTDSSGGGSSDGGSATDGGSSGADTGDGTSGVGSSSDSATDTSSQVTCEEQTEYYECPWPMPCGDPDDPDNWDYPMVACGPLEVFDENGCMRYRCLSDAECDAEERCYHPVDCDPDACVGFFGCMAGPEEGECSCGGDTGCGEPRGWCIAAGDYPC